METMHSTKDHQPSADARSKTYTCFACPKTYSSISGFRVHLNKKMPCNGVNIFSYMVVVLGDTLGAGTFKPEKNLEFFRLKSPGTHRCLPW